MFDKVLVKGRVEKGMPETGRQWFPDGGKVSANDLLCQRP